MLDKNMTSFKKSLVHSDMIELSFCYVRLAKCVRIESTGITIMVSCKRHNTHKLFVLVSCCCAVCSKKN